MSKAKGSTQKRKAERIQAAIICLGRQLSFSQVIEVLQKKFSISERTAKRDYVKAQRQIDSLGHESSAEQKAWIQNQLNRLAADAQGDPEMQLKVLDRKIKLLELDNRHGNKRNPYHDHTPNPDETDSTDSLDAFFRTLEENPTAQESPGA